MKLKSLLVLLALALPLIAQDDRPTVTGPWINAGSPQRSMIQSIGVTFDRNVSQLVKLESLKVRNIASGEMVDLSSATLFYDPRNNSANWMIDRDTNALLTDGNYLAWIETDTLLSEARRAACAASALPLDDYAFSFHQMAGDTDGDRDVDFRDSCVLRDTWRRNLGDGTYRSFLDFDLSELVDESDRGLFEQTYFSILPAEPAIHLFLRNDTGESFSDNATSLYSFGFASLGLDENATWVVKLDAREAAATGLVTNGSATLTETFINDLHGSELPPGTYQLTVEARDENGATIASDSLSFEYLGEVLCGPFFTSTPTPGVSLGQASGAQPLSLANWTVERYPGSQAAANWVIAPDGLSAEQTVNAAPSALISPQSLQNLRITGTFRVDTSSDDDLMGFIFGYQNPKQFYLFDWKQNTQGFIGGIAVEGMSIKRLDAGDGEFTEPDFWWSDQDRENTTILSPPNEIGWEDFQDYEITLDFIPGKIIVEVEQEGTVLDRLEVDDPNFAGGRFGFYNYSQNAVIYQGFTQQALNNNYFYDANAIDPDGGTIIYSFGPGAPEGAVINPTSGALNWEPTEAGTYPFTVIATDNDGLSDSQTFDVIVTPIDQFPEIVIRKTAVAVAPGEEITIEAVGSDAEQLFRTRLFINDIEVDPSADTATVSTTTSFDDLGQVEIRAVAIDSAEQVSSVTSFIRVVDPADLNPGGQNSTSIAPPGQSSGTPTDLRPLVSIEAPTIAEDDPTVFEGTVDPNGGTLARWAFEWAPAAKVNFENLASPTVLWQELATGTGPLAAEQFATITPGDFPDELIAFRLLGQNQNGLGAIASVVFNPQSNSNQGPAEMIDPGQGTPPSVAFTAPLTTTDDFSLVRGTIDATTGTLLSWTLDYAPRNQVNTDNLQDPEVSWTVLAQSTTPVDDSLLATLDQSAFTNEVYVFRLTALNEGGAGALATLIYNPTSTGSTGFRGPTGTTGTSTTNPATAKRPVCRIISPLNPGDDPNSLVGTVLANGGTIARWVVDYAARNEVNPNNLSDPAVTWTILAEGADEITRESLAPLTDPVFDNGVWIVRLRAFNSNGLGCLASTQLDSGDTSIPTVTLLSPEAETDITFITEARGTISAGGGVLDSWALEIAPTSEVTLANLGADANWRLLGSGTTAITDQPLGMIDPTGLQNGSYILRLRARNTSGRGIADGIIIHVCGEAKLGNFRLEFEDLNLPLAGIPIRINRIYDTLNANRSGDFGFGWTLGIGDPDLRETVPDTGDSFFFATPFEVGTRVFLTTPDGRRVGFTFNVRNPRNRFLFVDYEPYFEPDPGVYETLTIAPIDFERVEVAEDGAVYTPLLPFGYNPDNYRLTTKEGLTYHLNQRSGLQRITDRNNQQVTFSRNEIKHSSGQKVLLQRDPKGRITSIDAPQGSLKYAYDSRGDLISLTDFAGGVTKFTYLTSPAHFLSTVANPADAARGRFTRRVIYENGRVARIEDADGNPVGLEDYDPDTFSGSKTDAEGNVTTLRYDQVGNIVSTTTPEGRETSFEFNDPANPSMETARIEPDGRRFSYRYDAAGNGLEEVRPDGTRVENDYKNNQLSAVRIYDSEGTLIAEETNEYDGQGNLTKMTRNDGSVSELEYNERGLPTTFADFDGSGVSFTYNDSNTIPASITYTDGRKILITSNGSGKVTEIGYENGYREFREYDRAGRLTQNGVEDGKTKSYSYDENGFVSQVVDSIGRITTMQRDDAGLLLAQIFSHSDEAQPTSTVTYQRDKNGRLVGVTDPLGNETKFGFDRDGNITSRTDALAQTTSFQYNEGGRLAAITDRRGLKRAFTYHDGGGVSTESWHDEDDAVVREILYEYDSLSRLVKLTSPDSSYSYAYNTRDQLTSVDNLGTPDVPNLILSYTYGTDRDPVAITDNFGTTVDYQYDGGNRLDGITWMIGGNSVANVQLERSVRNFITGITRRSGDSDSPVVSQTTHERDSLMGVLEKITHTDGDGTLIAPDAEILYEYNREGLVTATSRGSDKTEYQYDHLGQLVSATNAATAASLESYRYDLAGNRTNSHLLGETTIGTGNRLTADELFTYEYDAEGNLTLKTEKSSGDRTIFTWDHLNRNTSVRVENENGNPVTTITKTFDVKNRLIAQSINGQKTFTVWEGIRPWVDFAETGQPLQRYLFGSEIDAIHATWTPDDGISWTLADLVGSVNFELSGNGQITGSYRYDSFGNLLQGMPDGLGFTARPSLLSGLQDFRARLFDSTTGRFLGEDPLGFAAGDLNLYRYGMNSPLSGSDPRGTEFSIAGQTTVVGIVGVLAKGAFTAATIATKAAATAAAVGAVGTLAVELFDFALSKFPCSDSRQLRLEKLIKTVTDGAVQNVKDSAAGGLIGIASAPLSAIWGFYTGPLYSAIKKAGTRSLECLRALQNGIEDMFKPLREAGLQVSPDIQPDF